MIAGQIWYGTHPSVTYGTHPTISCYDGTLTYTYYLYSGLSSPPPAGVNGRIVAVTNFDLSSNPYSAGPGVYYNGGWWCIPPVTSPPLTYYFTNVTERSGTINEMIVKPTIGLLINYDGGTTWSYPNAHAQVPV